jgi:hypothetical protein
MITYLCPREPVARIPEVGLPQVAQTRNAHRHVDDQRSWVGPLDSHDELISHDGVVQVKVIAVGGSVEDRGGREHTYSDRLRPVRCNGDVVLACWCAGVLVCWCAGVLVWPTVAAVPTGVPPRYRWCTLSARAPATVR